MSMGELPSYWRENIPENLGLPPIGRTRKLDVGGVNCSTNDRSIRPLRAGEGLDLVNCLVCQAQLGSALRLPPGGRCGRRRQPRSPPDYALSEASATSPAD